MSANKSFLPSWAAFAGLIVFAPVAFAQTAAFTLIDPSMMYTSFDPGNDGLRFTVGASDISVTSLGYFDAGQDGLLNSHPVGIFEGFGSNNLLTSVNVATPGATLSGAFEYAAITPVTLQAGKQYFVVGYTPGQSDPVNISGVAATAPGITYDGYYYNYDTSLTYPTTPDLNGPGYVPPYVGPNFQFTVIPEPSTYAEIFGAATLAFAAIRRRKPVQTAA